MSLSRSSTRECCRQAWGWRPLYSRWSPSPNTSWPPSNTASLHRLVGVGLGVWRGDQVGREEWGGRCVCVCGGGGAWPWIPLCSRWSPSPNTSWPPNSTACLHRLVGVGLGVWRGDEVGGCEGRGRGTAMETTVQLLVTVTQHFMASQQHSLSPQVSEGGAWCVEGK